MTNQELIRKATITTDAMANAGLLNAEQSDKFIDFVIDETTMKNRVRVVRFKRAQKLIEKINVAQRVALPKAEATDPGHRRGITTSKVTLNHEEIIVPFEIGDIVKEENIEEENVEDHIIKMMATRLANNMEEVQWDGNTTGPAILEEDYLEGGSSTLYRQDGYLALFNGWLKAAEAGHVVDAANAEISPALLGKAYRALPTKFRKNKALLKYLMSSDHEQLYREKVSTRATDVGDKALAASGNVPSYGIEMIPVSLFQPEPQYVEDSVANTDGTTATALTYGPISNVVITSSTLGASPEAAYILNTDYTVDGANGTWTRLATGSIPSGATVKVTYTSGGRIILTNPQNMISVIGRDVRIEKDRNIYRGVDEYVITAKIWCTFEETDAVVLLKNVLVPD
jgi:hypothetical protein